MPKAVTVNAKLSEVKRLAGTRARVLGRLVELSRDRNSEIRFRSIERLSEFRSDTARRRLREGLKDPDEIVRVASIEILGDWRDKRSFEHLIDALTDKKRLVRRAAAMALASLKNPRAVPILRERLESCRSDQEKASYSAALYSLGQKQFLIVLLETLSSADYRARSSAANYLAECASRQNALLVAKHLRVALKRESTVAAQSSLRTSLRRVSQMKRRPRFGDGR